MRGIAVAILCCSTLWSFAQREMTVAQTKKAQRCQGIFNQIAKVMSDNRQPPTLVFKPNVTDMALNVAHFNPKNNTINIGEGIYDITASLGADSTDALAYAIGHELAHFYKDHNWGMAFGTANEELEISKKIYAMDITSERRAAMEAEADYFGAVCAYLAGYKVFYVAEDFINAYYKLGVPDEVFGYPSKADRIKTIKEAQAKIRNSLPLLDAARCLVYQGKHQLAAQCYDKVATEFPNKALYNNAGVNYALAAMEMMKDSVKFHYPFTQDLTHLQDIGLSKGKRAVEGTPAKLLEMAREKFNAALRMDDKYVPALLNMALAEDLAGETESAWARILVAERHKSREMELLGHIFVAKGIIAHHNGEKGMTKRYFDQAMDVHCDYGKENMNVLKSGDPYRKRAVSAENKSYDESVNGLTPGLATVLKEEAEVTEIKAKSYEMPRIKIFSVEDLKYNAVIVTQYGANRGDYPFISTPAGYKGKSGGGIEIGSTVDDVLQKYGRPDLKISNLGENVYVYREGGVIFKTRDNKILGWTIYLN